MAGQQVLSGSLSFLSLGDILQLIGSNGSSGVLRITSKYASAPGVIYFVKGNIVNASTPDKTGLEAAYALFGWTDGEFEFIREDVNVEHTIKTNRMEIILDGLRMVDDGEIKKLGPVSFEKAPSGKAESNIPVIKGPLVDYMYVVDEEEYYPGQKFVQENSYGSWVWVILEGMVDIIKETPQGPLLILRLGDGAFIGNLSSFSFQNTIRTASAVAVNKVQLGVLDSQRLSKEFANMSPVFRDILISIEKRRRQITDRVVDMHLKTDLLKQFMKDKKLFMKQGSEDTKLLKIVEGDAFVVRKTKEGFVPFVSLDAGDFLGRVPFLDIGHEPLAASVFTSGELQTVPLNPEQLQKEYDNLSTTLRNMIESIAISVSVTTRLVCEYHRKNVKKK